jgi:hypothetical protein
MVYSFYKGDIMTGDVEHETKINDIMDSNTIRQLKNTVEIFNIIRDLSSNMSSDPLKKAMEERIQRSIIENIENFHIIGKTNKEGSKSHEDIPIYEKLSPGDVYILRIVNGELEVIENRDGDIKYKMAKLSIDKLL